MRMMAKKKSRQRLCPTAKESRSRETQIHLVFDDMAKSKIILKMEGARQMVDGRSDVVY